MFRSDEMVGCIRAKLESASKINKSEGEIESALEGDSGFARQHIDMWTTDIIMIPQDIFSMDVL